MKRFRSTIFIFISMLFIGQQAGCQTAWAANTAYTSEGKIIYDTTATIATSGIHWSQVGFTVRREATGGNPVKNDTYAVLWLKEKYRTTVDNKDGTYRVTYTIPEKDIEAELAKAGILKGKGNVLYLNGIFQVIRYGKADTGYYRTLAGIKGAAYWRNPRDFDELFDVKVTFDDPTPPEQKPLVEKTKKEGAGEAAAYAVLQAEKRDAEVFDAEKGIPGEEPLYANGWCRRYLRSYEYKKIQGEKLYPVTVKRTYHLSWTEKRVYTDEETGELKEKLVPRSREQTVSKVVYAARKYTYWQIEDLYLGVPERMEINNKALPGEKAVMEAAGYTPPSLEYKRYSGETGHLKEPSYAKSLTLSSKSVSGGSLPPEVPNENFQSYGEREVPEIKVRNDSLVFEGKTIMEDDWKETKTDSPLEFPEAGEQTGDNVFYKTGLFLPVSRKNGSYASEGKVIYRPQVYIKEQNNKKRSFEIEDINPVFVHTPVVCNGSVEDKYRECQMLFPDRERGQLILGKSFRVILSAKGHHRSIPGYGYQDYSRYIKRRQVKFPFAVLQNGVRREKNTWFTMGEEEAFYLPEDTPEGKYRVEFRCIAKNGAAGEKEERWANLSEETYVGTDWTDVEVSGQLREFSIYDISDYPLWQQVFRKKNSLEPTGFAFTVKQLPLRNGSHPLFKNQGVLKPGYTLRMSCLTMGEMEEEGDYLRIIPRFYYLSSDLKSRKEVDVYYSETVDGTFRQLIQAGSQKDLENVKKLQLKEPYLSIPQKELVRTAAKKKQVLEKFLQQEHKTFTYTNIMLSSRMQMLSEVKGVQKWYFEYYLPSQIYVTEKGFPLEAYQKRNELNLQEDFWIKDGFLVLNFDIETIQKGKRHLSYRNEAMAAAGYRNQWLYEKNGVNPEPFALGEIALFDLRRSAAIDYQSRGTH